MIKHYLKNKIEHKKGIYLDENKIDTGTHIYINPLHIRASKRSKLGVIKNVQMENNNAVVWSNSERGEIFTITQSVVNVCNDYPFNSNCPNYCEYPLDAWCWDSLTYNESPCCWINNCTDCVTWWSWVGTNNCNYSYSPCHHREY